MANKKHCRGNPYFFPIILVGAFVSGRLQRKEVFQTNLKNDTTDRNHTPSLTLLMLGKAKGEQRTILPA